jgi:catechol 2,3-dioxygenase-like lactoylglutathione lyase family enzyme
MTDLDRSDPPAGDLGLTHIALTVRDVEASVRFYRRYAGLHGIHERGSGTIRVGWISDLRRPFGLVLVERRIGPLRAWLARQLEGVRPAMHHIGIAVATRADVDRLCETARREGILRRPPRDAGHPVNYYGMIGDPDGNRLEVSCGQVMSIAFAEAFTDDAGRASGPELLENAPGGKRHHHKNGDDR